jgi:hypothetical protein
MLTIGLVCDGCGAEAWRMLKRRGIRWGDARIWLETVATLKGWEHVRAPDGQQ